MRKSVVGYEDYYEVSDDGKIFRIAPWRNTYNGRERKQTIDRNGYFYVYLSMGGKLKFCLVHRLVAIAFIENPNNLYDINHKDMNKKNNHVSNLEWVSRKENIAHAIKNRKFGPCKPIIGINYKTDHEIEFNSISDAVRSGFSRELISKCCNRDINDYSGYVWRFKY